MINLICSSVQRWPLNVSGGLSWDLYVGEKIQLDRNLKLLISFEWLMKGDMSHRTSVLWRNTRLTVIDRFNVENVIGLFEL